MPKVKHIVFIMAASGNSYYNILISIPLNKKDVVVIAIQIMLKLKFYLIKVNKFNRQESKVRVLTKEQYDSLSQELDDVVPACNENGVGHLVCMNMFGDHQHISEKNCDILDEVEFISSEDEISCIFGIAHEKINASRNLNFIAL